MMSLMFRWVLWLRVLSCSRFYLMKVQAFCTGIAVNKEMTSNETITSSSAISISLISLTNSFEFSTARPFLFCSGERMSARNFEVWYSAEPMLVTMGLKGLFGLMFD